MTAPNVIWLQWGDEAEDEYVYPSEGVTWCSDQINDTDVRYVRADAQPAERVRTYRIMDDTGELVGVWQLPETAERREPVEPPLEMILSLARAILNYGDPDAYYTEAKAIEQWALRLSRRVEGA